MSYGNMDGSTYCDILTQLEFEFYDNAGTLTPIASVIVTGTTAVISFDLD